jgi:PAS domain-containing protein
VLSQESVDFGQLGATTRVADVLQRLDASPNLAWAVDQDQRIVYCNPAWARYVGVRSDEAIGQPCIDFLKASDPQGKRLCRRDCLPQLDAQAGVCPIASRFRIRSTEHTDEWLSCTYTVLDTGDSSFLLLHVAEIVTDMMDALQLLSKIAGSVQTGEPYPRAGSPHAWMNPPAAFDGLTLRESDVLRCLGKGMTTEQMATDLALSQNTIRNYVKGVLAKLDVHS